MTGQDKVCKLATCQLLQAPRHERSQGVLCKFKAVGKEYLKYIVSGVNIVFMNLMMLVVFTTFNAGVLRSHLSNAFITSPLADFLTGLASTMALCYFVGMAVGSISSQASLGMGACINASFGSIVEILLFVFMNMDGKVEMVHG